MSLHSVVKAYFVILACIAYRTSLEKISHNINSASKYKIDVFFL